MCVSLASPHRLIEKSLSRLRRASDGHLPTGTNNAKKTQPSQTYPETTVTDICHGHSGSGVGITLYCSGCTTAQRAIKCMKPGQAGGPFARPPRRMCPPRDPGSTRRVCCDTLSTRARSGPVPVKATRTKRLLFSQRTVWSLRVSPTKSQNCPSVRPSVRSQSDRRPEPRTF